MLRLPVVSARTALLVRLALTFFACAALTRAAAIAPDPTFADVHYGPFERNRLDFWAAPGASAEHPAPLVIFIHGGGFSHGDKTQVRDSKLVRQCLDAGLAFAAIDYRFRDTAPLPAILRDCARALQFLRAQAATWHLDPDRVAAYGSSAGAGTSLWLAFHPDLADPQNPDPVLRQSTRLTCAGALSVQFSYDFLRWHELFGDDLVARYGKSYLNPAFYGLATDAELRGPAGAAIRADCDMLGLMTPDDPPFFVSPSLPTVAVDNVSEFLHSPKHSGRLYDRAREIGIPVVAVIPALKIAPPPGAPANLRDFLFAHLRPARSQTTK